MHNQAHTRAIAALSALGPMRVWSLLVTIFGDLAPDHPLDGPTLSELMDKVGIRPEATRVALHRLRADGWIMSQKRGRISQYSLTPKGREDSDAARAKIYGPPETAEKSAKFVLMRESTARLDAGTFASIAPRLFLCASETPTPSDAMTLSIDDTPEWLGAQFEPTALVKSYRTLHDVLSKIDAEVTGGLHPLETATLRVMIVHAWRRIVLKHPNLPRGVHSPEWRGHACRVLVTRLLDRFERPPLDQLSAR